MKPEITLRDLFAAAAMHGMASINDDDRLFRARVAYAYADAMLEARREDPAVAPGEPSAP